MPVGNIESDAIIPALQEFVSAHFFGVSVKLLPGAPIHITGKGNKRAVHSIYDNYKYPFRSRRCHPYDLHKVPENHRQILADSILGMAYHIKPSDAFCLCCITSEDLYEGTDGKCVCESRVYKMCSCLDSFTCGLAAGGDRVGVFSLARYNPEFLNKPKKRAREHEKLGMTENELILMQRACKIIVHEIMHNFNIGHCR